MQFSSTLYLEATRPLSSTLHCMMVAVAECVLSVQCLADRHLRRVRSLQTTIAEWAQPCRFYATIRTLLAKKHRKLAQQRMFCTNIDVPLSNWMKMPKCSMWMLKQYQYDFM